MATMFIAGTAGAGKSTLVGAFKNWVEMNGYQAITVNLDPGAEVLAYEADVDVREWVVLGQIMEEFNLGPNGAQVVAADMMALLSGELMEVVEELEADYALYDVPGQLELFAFRSSSKRLVENLGGPRPLMVYLMDPMLVATPTGYLTSMLLGATVQFRLQVPMLYALSKVDLLDAGQVETIKAWSEDDWRLESDLYDGEITAATGFAVDLLEAFRRFGVPRQVTPVSSASGLGMEDLYSTIQMVYAGGDDLEKR